MRSRPDIGLVGAFSLFAVGLVLSICAVRLQVGPLPVRSLFMLSSLGLLALSHPQLLIETMHRSGRILLLIGLVAAIGIGVSLLNRLAPAIIVQQLLEIHFQAFIGVVLAYALASGLGVRLVGMAFVAAFLISAIFATGQALGIDFAWQARAIIGGWMNDAPVNQGYYLKRERGLGLSFSSIHFATQACLAFAAFFVIRLAANRGRLGFDPILMGALAVAVILCIVTGNRSPILGFVIFVTIWGFVAVPRVALIGLPVALVLVAAAIPLMDMLADQGVRIASRDDGSAEGRETLRAFGWFLWTNRPLGYGLGFDSTRYWPLFSHEAIYMPNVLTMRTFTLHNYYLMVLNKYGITILAALPFIIPRSRVAVYGWVAFIPYIVHIFYHNDGPFQGDFLIWFIIPLFALVAGNVVSWGEGHDLAPKRPVPRWRRLRARTS